MIEAIWVPLCSSSTSKIPSISAGTENRTGLPGATSWATS